MGREWQKGEPLYTPILACMSEIGKRWEKRFYGMGRQKFDRVILMAEEFTEAPLAGAIRIVLIDDQEEVRELLGLQLSMQPGIEVVGLASSGYDGIMMVEKIKPDVVLTDLRMPGINGIQTTQEILRRAAEPKPSILLMTAFDDDEYVFEAIEAGASGYLLKDTDLEDIANAIRLVHSNGSHQFAERLEQRVLQRLRPYSKDGDRTNQRFMTERDFQIVNALAQEKSNQEIASELVMSSVDIARHLDNLMSHQGLNSREELVLWSKDRVKRDQIQA